MLKALIKPVLVFVIGLALGVASNYLGFNLKSEICAAAGPSVSVAK